MKINGRIVYARIKKTLRAWNLHEEIKDKELLADVISAMYEAYMRGAYDSSKSKELLDMASSYESLFLKK